MTNSGSILPYFSGDDGVGDYYFFFTKNTNISFILFSFSLRCLIRRTLNIYN